ncbi:MAG TPA: ATP-binding protein [Gemmatimonadales bacterium]|nr:ATP-binding protein [Gemmatimonadales bacterium]
MTVKPWLRTELLFNLAFLAAAALLLGVTTVLLVAALAPERALPFMVLVVPLDIVLFIVFGRYLISRLVLRPVERLVAVADAVAGGDFAARAESAETRDFQILGERINRMTDHLLDAQSQLVRSEKLASVGRLAAGIAHEVGNPLGAMGTYLEVLRRRGADPDVVAGLSREVDRIDHIVRSLLDYARPQEEALVPIEPGAVVEGAHGLLMAQGVLRSVSTRLEVSQEVPQILGRAHLLEQVIVNLVLNAVDAAPRGIVVLGARRWDFEPGRALPRRETDTPRTSFARQPARRPGRIDFAAGESGALVFVADSGPGVAFEDRARVFDPFFTTKDPGRGTGLGLAIVARAVDDMGGVVWVDTAREGGAAFKMFFPAADRAPRAAP